MAHAALTLALWALGVVAPAGAGQAPEARVSVDLREADIVDIVSLLADVAGFQVVFDPGVECALTLKLKQVRWQQVLDAALRACRLAREEEGGVLRIATPARLTEEAEQRRRLAEERARNRPRSVTRLRLSYARAAEMAPLVKHFVSDRGQVVYDERTNTLIIID